MQLKKVIISMLVTLGICSSCSRSEKAESFESFVNAFIPNVAEKSKQLNLAYWILETTGSSDAATLVASLSTDLSLMFNNQKIYEQLVTWEKEGKITDQLLKRQLTLLIYAFKSKAFSPELVKEIATKEAALSLSYANFRPTLDEKRISENDILEILKNQTDPKKRQEAWNASKEIGTFLAPQILELVKLRNKAAQSLGYANYFQMQLDLQEVDEQTLFKLLDEIADRSDEAYKKALETINLALSKKFSTPIAQLGPWAWSDPFCQEDPLDRSDLDSLVANADLVEVSRNFYQKMGIDVELVLKRSSLFEQPGKNQHAFCINIDRKSDVRTLENLKPTLKWFETILHELGHAIYELGFNPNLPWQLREPPHMITTEAMALLAGRRAYLASCLTQLPTYTKNQDPLIQKAEDSLKRRQLIFSRWVLVMTHFERELYQNPSQDLNKLWWSLVSKYQKITPPEARSDKNDWAAKYHIGLAPVYYYSYLLGEVFASSMENLILQKTGSQDLDTKGAGNFLQERLFFPGNTMKWSDLIEHVIGSPLSADAWLDQFTEKS